MHYLTAKSQSPHPEIWIFGWAPVRKNPEEKSNRSSRGSTPIILRECKINAGKLNILSNRIHRCNSMNATALGTFAHIGF